MFTGSPAVSPASNPSAHGPARKRQLLLCHTTALLWYTSTVLQAMPPFHDNQISCVPSSLTDTTKRAFWQVHGIRMPQPGSVVEVVRLALCPTLATAAYNGTIAMLLMRSKCGTFTTRHKSEGGMQPPKYFARHQVSTQPAYSYCLCCRTVMQMHASALRKLIDAPPTSPGTGKFCRKVALSMDSPRLSPLESPARSLYVNMITWSSPSSLQKGRAFDRRRPSVTDQSIVDMCCILQLDALGCTQRSSSKHQDRLTCKRA